METLGLFPSVADFFPEIRSDFSRVKWGHAVNSRSALQQSLDGNDPSVNIHVRSAFVCLLSPRPLLSLIFRGSSNDPSSSNFDS